MSELARLRWKCRRGTLELDLILGRFLDTHYPALPAEQQAAFAVLLESADEVLWHLINGDDPGATPGEQAVLARLRTC